jgi:hypothetical protein
MKPGRPRSGAVPRLTLLLATLLLAFPAAAAPPRDCGDAVASGGVVSVLFPGDSVVEAFVATSGGAFVIASVGDVAWSITTLDGDVLAAGSTELTPASVERVPPGHAVVCVVATNQGAAPAPLLTRYG